MNSKNIGMVKLKNRRLHLQVGCHPGTTIGQYVPFYFCPRSVMLFVIHKDNHPELTYHGGQAPIAHMQIDMHSAIEWANQFGHRWAFSDAHAVAKVAAFYKDVEHLNQIDWRAVAATEWRPPAIQERKQAEFLIYDRVPWELVEKIGVINDGRKEQVGAILAESSHIPMIEKQRNWYY